MQEPGFSQIAASPLRLFRLEMGRRRAPYNSFTLYECLRTNRRHPIDAATFVLGDSTGDMAGDRQCAEAFERVTCSTQLRSRIALRASLDEAEIERRIRAAECRRRNSRGRGQSIGLWSSEGLQTTDRRARRAHSVLDLRTPVSQMFMYSFIVNRGVEVWASLNLDFPTRPNSMLPAVDLIPELLLLQEFRGLVSTTCVYISFCHRFFSFTTYMNL